ncbi:MAG: transposase [Patescibacteria group bacterium]
MSRYFLDDSYYFITIPTFQRKVLFTDSQKKHLILQKIHEAIKKFSVKEVDYGILQNHYHIVALMQDGKVIPKFLQHINGGTSYAYQKIYGPLPDSAMWDEYHVYVAEKDEVLAKIRGYVMGNPLKHGEVKSLQALMTYPFSSYNQSTNKYGQKMVDEWIRSVIALDEDTFFSQLNKLPD